MSAGLLIPAAESPGIFGKLPWLGDFVTRRLPHSFVEPWDDWLQRGMAATREALGDGWLDSFLTAPVWRFLLPAGSAGPAMAGVLMPSVDRVGRYFPPHPGLAARRGSRAGGAAARRRMVRRAGADRARRARRRHGAGGMGSRGRRPRPPAADG